MPEVKKQITNTFSFINKIKLLFNNKGQVATEKFIIAQKSCPHCASRGMFIFNQPIKKQSTNSK